MESVRASGYSNYEVIVVDDGSDSVTRRQLESVVGGRFRLIESDRAKGPSGARNTGAYEAKARFLIFLDSDDLLAPWCLEQRVERVHASPENDLWVFPVLLFHDQPGDRRILWNSMEFGDDANRFVQSDSPWHTSSPVWLRESFLRLGGFNEQVFYGDDWELHLRAVLSGLAIAKFPESLPDVFVRRSDEARITSGLSPSLATARLVRLEAGSELLRRERRLDLLSTFEGQYLAEAEFLLFNAAEPVTLVQRLLERWRTDYPRSRYRPVAEMYLKTALASRDRSYLLLRAARVFTRLLLPSFFFPSGGQIESAEASARTMAKVRSAVSESDRER
jgi:glycosyltransferase involved in cell wall biosynthesis